MLRFGVDDVGSSELQYGLIGKLGSLAIARKQRVRDAYTRVDSAAVVDRDRPNAIAGIVGKKELRLGRVTMCGHDVFLTGSECCYRTISKKRAFYIIPWMSVRMVMMFDMFRTSDILVAFQ